MAEFIKSRRRTKPILDRHFDLMEKMQRAFYRREVDRLASAIKLCNAMIALASDAMAAFKLDHHKNSVAVRKSVFSNLKSCAAKEFQAPAHPCFQRLAIVRERQKILKRSCADASRQKFKDGQEPRMFALRPARRNFPRHSERSFSRLNVRREPIR